jgi:hypothetical protein
MPRLEVVHTLIKYVQHQGVFVNVIIMLFHFYIDSFSNFDDPSFDDSQMLSQFLIKLCFYGGVQILLNFKNAWLLRL